MSESTETAKTWLISCACMSQLCLISSRVSIQTSEAAEQTLKSAAWVEATRARQQPRLLQEGGRHTEEALSCDFTALIRNSPWIRGTSRAHGPQIFGLGFYLPPHR